jgi:hypothetical protein
MPPSIRARRTRTLVASERSREEVWRYLLRIVLFGTLALLCALAVADGALFLAALAGVGAVLTGSRVLDRRVTGAGSCSAGPGITRASSAG